MPSLALVDTDEQESLENLTVEQIQNGFRFTDLIERPLDTANLDAMGELIARMTVVHARLREVAPVS